MEIEQTPKVVAKKLWNMVRVVFLMVRKGLSKTKILSDLHFFFKRGNLAGKAINSLVELHQNSTFSCVSTDIANSFISPREYEFSCSNSPAYPFHFPKRKQYRPKPYRYHNDAAAVAAFQRVLDMLSNEKGDTNSPLVALPGFGKSPLVRQMRITDSPFSVKDEGNSTVDMDAEEFIKKFRADLKLQKMMAAVESPCYSVTSRCYSVTSR